MADERRPSPQQEPVHAPHGDDAPPKRTVSPVLWLAVGFLAAAALAIALVVAAIDAA